MKKIVEVNCSNFGSTGNIMLNIANVAESQGMSVFNCFPRSRDNLRRQVKNQIIIGNRVSRNIHLFLSSITGLNGAFSVMSTFAFITKLHTIKPDIIHLHNLHNSYINLPILFCYIKKSNVRVIWTLHDCWPFTGKCAYFTYNHCDKWKVGCDHCEFLSAYPPARVDRTRKMWKLKKKWFTGVQDLTIVTPSHWLAGLVKQSFLKEYPVLVFNNGIDLGIFKPTSSDFREKCGVVEKESSLT